MDNTRKKIRIRLPPYRPPHEPPRRTCWVCDQVRDGWEFSSRFGICCRCTGEVDWMRGARTTAFPGLDWRDGSVMNQAAVVIALLQGKNVGQSRAANRTIQSDLVYPESDP